MEKGIDELVEFVKKITDPIEKELKRLGSTKKTIDLFFEGEEILICPGCCTFNLREVYYDKLGHYSEYQCENCGHPETKYWKIY